MCGDERGERMELHVIDAVCYVGGCRSIPFLTLLFLFALDGVG